VQTLKVYVGVFAAQGYLQAFLSDFSAPAYTDTSVQDIYVNHYGVYTLSFATASPNQTLKVRFKANAIYDATFGSVILSAVSLSGFVPPHAVVLLNPAWNNGTFNFSFVTQSNATHVAEYTDALAPAFWQPLTNFTGDGTLATIFDFPVPSSKRMYRVGTH